VVAEHTRPLTIAVTHPTTFDVVQRGTERFVHELACYMAARGHRVRVIACKAGKSEQVELGGYLQHSHRRIWHPLLQKLGVLEAHSFLLTSMRELLRHRFDVVQCCSFTDAYAASIARAWTKTPYAYFVNGLPPRVPYFESLTMKGAVFRRAVVAADELIVPSEYVSRYCQERFGRGGRVLAVPVDLALSKLVTERDHSHPVILCAADLSDRRKGGEVLMRAFNLVKARKPAARLEVWSRKLPDQLVAELLASIDGQWRGDVSFLGPAAMHELPAVFGRAAVSVLPSLWEAFGLVIIESLATGTPVVGTRDGAIPTILDDPGVGRLFDPGADATVAPTNAPGLAQALLDALELSRQPETAARCRQRAERYSWEIIGAQYEEMYRRLAARREPA
jgi:phosphatidylinositol alpha-mannosyltransferase